MFYYKTNIKKCAHISLTFPYTLFFTFLKTHATTRLTLIVERMEYILMLMLYSLRPIKDDSLSFLVCPN